MPDTSELSSGRDDICLNAEGRFARAEIREVIEAWSIARDSADWELLLATWHRGGSMVTTWFDGSAAAFVAASRKSWEQGSRSFHSLGGSQIEVDTTRAVAQTRMSINVRGYVAGVEVDVVSAGRFFDFFEKRQGRWRIVHRRPIYEKDRLDPVEPGVNVPVDLERLRAWPEGYRYLAYLQSFNGTNAPGDLPALRGPAVDRLMEDGRKWLSSGGNETG